MHLDYIDETLISENLFDVKENLFLVKIKDYPYNKEASISYAHVLCTLEMSISKESLVWHEQNDGFDFSEILFIINNLIENGRKYERAI